MIESKTLPSKVEAREYFVGEGQAFMGPTLETRVSQRYVYRDEKVKGFLAGQPQLAQTLIDALPKIEEFFGAGTVVSLRVSCDQESAPTLSANIQTAWEVSKARAARKSFNVSWWMRHPHSDELPLTFNVEYV